MKRILTTGIFFLLIFCFACKKEEEGNKPVLDISEPIPGQTVNAGESFWLSGKAQDESGISSIQIKLLDEDFKDVSILLVDRYAGEKEIEFNFFCMIDDPALQSGEYHIKIKVLNTESNNSQEFIRIHLIGIQKELMDILLITNSFQGALNLYKWSLDEPPAMVKSLQGNYLHSAFSPEQQQFYLVNKQSREKLMAFDPESWEQAFALELPMPYPYFQSIQYNSPYLYFFFFNGSIIGVDQLGFEKFSTPANPDTLPNHFAIGDEFIVAGCKGRIGNQDVLRVFYEHSGSYVKRKVLNCEPVDIFHLSDDEFLIFGNQNDSTRVYRYHADINWLEESGQTPYQISSISPVHLYEYLVLLDDNWYRYHALANAFIPEDNLNDFQFLKFESLSEKIYTIREKTLLILDQSTGAVSDSCVLNDPVVDFQFQYNK